LFVDDIVLVVESREGIISKLERLRETLKSKGFKINRMKIKYMKNNFVR